MLKARFLVLVLLCPAVQVNAQSPQAVQYGNVVFGTLLCNCSNVYSFAGSNGDEVLVEVTETADTGYLGYYEGGGCFFDVKFQIADATSAVVSSAESPLGSGCPKPLFRTQDGPFVLPHDGTYTITVSNRSGISSGAYTLYLQRTMNPAGATSLQSSTPVLVPLQAAGSVQSFVFSAAQDAAVDIEMQPQTGNLIPMLALYGPDGAPVALPNGGAIRTTLAQAGTYALLAFSASGETGTYNLVLKPSIPSSIAQLASGGGWATTITLINTSLAPVQAVLNFFDDNGNPLQLPLSFPQGTATPIASSSFTGRVEPGAEILIQSTGAVGQPLLVGWAQLLATDSISAFTVFTHAIGTSLQEAVVPLENRTPGAFLLSFDNTDNYATGVALANVSAVAVDVGVIIRDDTGAAILTNSITLPAQGHTSFVLASNYPMTAQGRGTMEFDTPANGQISVLGLRFNPTGAFSSLPAIAK